MTLSREEDEGENEKESPVLSMLMKFLSEKWMDLSRWWIQHVWQARESLWIPRIPNSFYWRKRHLVISIWPRETQNGFHQGEYFKNLTSLVRRIRREEFSATFAECLEIMRNTNQLHWLLIWLCSRSCWLSIHWWLLQSDTMRWHLWEHFTTHWSIYSRGTLR